MLRLLTAMLFASCFFTAPPATAQTEIPPLTGRVMDPAEILSESTERTLTDLLKAHEDSTGNQIVVATVPSLEGEAIEEFALRAGRTWQIGTAEHDNGILLVVAPSERKVRIEVGYGLEGAVPDAVAAQIIRNEIIPEFRDGDFDAGVAAGTMALLEAARGEYEADDGSSDGPPPIAVRIIFGFVFGVVFLVVSFGALMAKSKGLRWFLLIVLLPFALLIGGFVAMSVWTGLLAALGFGSLFIYLSNKPSVQDLRERMAEAAKKGETVSVAVGPFTMQMGGSSGSGSGGSGWGGGGGGFSGGGGSFGGGGASGGW